MPRSSRMERVYASALRLYPARFREAYALAMRQAFRDALADSTLARQTFIPLVVWDLIVSIAKEHFAMLRESIARPALVFNALVLAGISTVLALALYAIPQQVLRQGLNDPQIQLAGDLVALLEKGVAPAEAVPAGQVDMARSLAPFVIAYDDQGRPLASQAMLNGGVPAPPAGVFDYVRQHGEERVSWQPILGNVRGVRIASVVMRVGGTHPGFVLAGRNMREVEAREEQVGHMAGLAWLGMLGLIVIGSLAFGWYTDKPTA
ncbi:MAG: hypothetical protein WAM85_07915 [Terracidiphilus sp.]